MMASDDEQFMAHDINYLQFPDVHTWCDYINKNSTSFNIIHVNICSMKKHFNELLATVHGCYNYLDIICITEINIKHNELPMYELDGFNMFSWTREKRRGGGILLYARNNLTFTQNYIQMKNCELITGTLFTDHNKTTIVVIYRPPNTDRTGFLTEIYSYLSTLSGDIILLGDVNINILEQERDNTATRYLDMMCECGMLCAIQDVTRECVSAERRTATCIDHVFVRNATIGASLCAYTVRTKIADHYITGLTADLCPDATKLGVPIEGFVRVQLNLKVDRAANIRINNINKFPDTIFPVMWVEEGIHEVTTPIWRWIFLATTVGPIAGPILTYSMIVFGLLALIIIFVRAYKSFVLGQNSMEIVEYGRETLRRGSTLIIHGSHKLLTGKEATYQPLNASQELPTPIPDSKVQELKFVKTDLSQSLDELKSKLKTEFVRTNFSEVEKETLLCSDNAFILSEHGRYNFFRLPETIC